MQPPDGLARVRSTARGGGESAAPPRSHLVGDVVGYSRPMGQDERGTLRRLKVIRQNRRASWPCRQDDWRRHCHRVPSAVEAVACAVAIQRTSRAYSESVHLVPESGVTPGNDRFGSKEPV